MHKNGYKSNPVLIGLREIARELHSWNFLKRKAVYDQMVKSFLNDETVYIPGSVSENCIKVRRLPEKLIVNGNLDLSKLIGLLELPQISLRVAGNLIMQVRLERIPPKLEVGGALNLWDAHIEHLPDNVKLGGLIANKLKTLPNIKKIDGDVNISGSPISSFPSELKFINGDLTIGENQFEYVNDEITVQGRFYIWGSPKLKRIGKFIKVKEDVWIEGHTTLNSIPTGIKSLCNQLQCESLVFGHFNHKNVDIELPEKLETNEVLFWFCSSAIIDRMVDQLKEKGFVIDKDRSKYYEERNKYVTYFIKNKS
jgi:hypothetical protein